MMLGDTNNRFSASRAVVVLASGLLVGLFLVALLSQMLARIDALDALTQMRLAPTLQNLIVFMLPAVWDLIASVVCVGLLTGLGEEMFFRGALQRICCDGMRRRHLAVWTAAFVFSTLHFQFFGFVPRLVLGAFFGYAYLWSGSLWVPVIGHAFNNSAVVAFMWMGNNSIDAASMGEAGSQSAVVAIVSAVVTVAMMVAYKKILANGKKAH